MRVLKLGELEVDLELGVVQGGPRPVHLTEKEASLLAYLGQRAGRTVPREELLVEVWGYHPSSTSRAIDKTLNRLRAKLEPDPKRPQFLLTRRGEGHRLVAETSVGGPSVASLFGRDADRARLDDALSGPGIVQIRGAAGVGKSALASALTAGRARIWVELSGPLDEAVARVLGVPVGAVAQALADRGPAVLVLDGLRSPDPVIESWAAAPKLRILVTGGPPLQGGRVVLLEGLDAEAGHELLEQRSGRALRPETTAPLVEAMAGNPRALELAAGTLGRFRPEDLLRGDVPLLDICSGGGRSLRTMVEAAWEGLSPGAQQTLISWCALPGSVGVELLEDELAEVEELVERGVVSASWGHTGRRVRVSGPMRRLIEERGIPDAVRLARARRVATGAQRLRVRWVEEGQFEAANRLREEGEAVLAAATLLLDAGELEAAVDAVEAMCEVVGLESLSVLERFPATPRVRALRAFGHRRQLRFHEARALVADQDSGRGLRERIAVEMELGNLEAARELAAGLNLEIWQERRLMLRVDEFCNGLESGPVWNAMATECLEQGRIYQAVLAALGAAGFYLRMERPALSAQAAELGLRRIEELDNSRLEGRLYLMRGASLAGLGRGEEALASYLQAAALYSELGDRRGSVSATANCAGASLLCGDVVTAQRHCEEALLGATGGQLEALLMAQFGVVRLFAGHPDEAADLIASGLERIGRLHPKATFTIWLAVARRDPCLLDELPAPKPRFEAAARSWLAGEIPARSNVEDVHLLRRLPPEA